MKPAKKSFGVTLIELLVVMSILAMIGGIAFSMFGSNQRRKTAVRGAATQLLSGINLTASKAKSLGLPVILDPTTAGGVPAAIPPAPDAGKLIYRIYQANLSEGLTSQVISSSELGDSRDLEISEINNLPAIPPAGVSSGVFGNIENTTGTVFATFLFTPGGRLVVGDSCVIPTTNDIDPTDRFAVSNARVGFPNGGTPEEISGFINLGAEVNPISISYNIQGQAQQNNGNIQSNAAEVDDQEE